MEKKYIEFGITGILLGTTVHFLKNYFTNKINSAKQSDDIKTDGEKVKLNQNKELFDLFKQSYRKQEDKISKLEVELIEMKKMIADNSYMGSDDYRLFIKTYLSLMFHNIENELRLIVERNNINETTLDLTNKKIINFIERLTNDSLTSIDKIHFYRNVITKTTILISGQKEYIISVYSEPFKEYAISTKDSVSKKDEALKNISEITKYLSNKLIANFQDIMKTEIY